VVHDDLALLARATRDIGQAPGRLELQLGIWVAEHRHERGYKASLDDGIDRRVARERELFAQALGCVEGVVKLLGRPVARHEAEDDLRILRERARRRLAREVRHLLDLDVDLGDHVAALLESLLFLGLAQLHLLLRAVLAAVVLVKTRLDGTALGAVHGHDSCILSVR